MHVLDILIGKRHGHKVSFDKTSEQETSPSQRNEAASSSSSSSTKAEATTAAGPSGATAAAAAAAPPPPAPSSSSSSTTTSNMPHQGQQHAGPQHHHHHGPGHHHHPQQQAAAAAAVAVADPANSKLKSKLELKRLLRRAAVSFRDLSISVHEASTNCLAQLHDTAGAAPHTHTGASVLTATGRQRVAVEQKKLAIIMVGLPGRGKTFVCNKLKCYLNWLGHPTQHFNVGQYRRKIKEEDSIQDAAFFDHNNPIGLAERERAFQLALADMMGYLRSDAGQVAIFDATNSTQERREKLSDALRGSGIRFIFIENICNDPDILQQNYLNKMMYSPDYKGIPTEKAVSDFMERIAKYEEIYEPIADRVMHYIKLTDMVTGRGHIDINRISGYLSGKIVFYLMQVCKGGMTNARKIWLTRHGESEYNQKALIGGDSPLSANGQAYAEMLPDVILSRLPKGPEGVPVPVSVWTSTLQRTILTAAGLPFAKLKWKALDEIDAGICDGMTYAQIAQKYPAEFEARKKDKLRYRYPRGESYLDLVQRLEPVISEMEREGESIVIVSHQAVLRVIFGYLMARSQQSIPSISIPLHTVIELTPRPDGTMGVEYIPVPVHLADASMLTTSMDALPAAAAAAVAAAATAADGGGGGGDAVGCGGSSAAGGGAGGVLSPVMSPLSPAVMLGLDPAAAAALGACPFKQDEPVGTAAEVVAAAAGHPHLPGGGGSSGGGAGGSRGDGSGRGGADAAVLIGDGASSSSSHSTGMGAGLGSGCGGLSAQRAGTVQEAGGDLQRAESLPCYYYVEGEEQEQQDGVGELPLLDREQIQRMSSCSSGSTLALMQQLTSATAAVAPAGCLEQ